MIADMGTMIWKEWKELFMQRSSTRSGLLSVVIILALVGVYLPLQMGRDWLTNPVATVVWAWMPIFMALSMITDAFAGERERHTLETLLASRLSDRAILFGKIAAAVLYAWFIAFSGLLLGALVINVVHPTGSFQFYAPGFFAVALVVSLLGAVLISSLGVWVSLHSSTARQAYQKLSVGMLVIFFIPMMLPNILPAERMQSLLIWLQTLNVQSIVLIGSLVLLVVDVVLLIFLTTTFQRSRLMESMD